MLDPPNPPVHSSSRDFFAFEEVGAVILAYNRVGEVEIFHAGDDNVCDGSACKPFMVGRNNVPGRPIGAGLSNHFFIGFHIGIPMGPLFQIRRGEFPVFCHPDRCVRETASSVLFWKREEKI